MANLTLSIDSDVLKKARKIAIDRETSVNAIVRDYLEDLVRSEGEDPQEVIARLQAMYDRTTLPVSPIRWRREDLYDR